MSKLRDAAQQALEALEWADNAMYEGTPIQVNTQKAITALRAALAEQPAEQEPVEIEMPEYHSHGMGCGLEDRGITDRYEAMEYGWYEAIDRVKEELANFGPLYTAPQPVKREPPTDEEIDRVTDVQWASNNHKPIYAAHRAYARAIIAAYERKNGIGEQT